MFSYRTEEEVLDRMVGSTVQNLLSKDDDHFILVTDKGNFEFQAEGDCCSHSYFLNISDLNELIGKTLTLVTRREETKPAEWENDYSLSLYYGADFNYIGGSVFLEMRNDSNGYYGGWCEVKVVS